MTAGTPATPHLLLQLAHHVTVRPDQLAVAFVEADGQHETPLTYAELDRAARALAGSLVDRHGFAPGDHALLVYPPSLDVVVAFLACMMAGVIPVPVAPPNPLDPQAGMALFQALTEDCAPRAVLTNTTYLRARRAGTLKSWVTTLGGPGWPRLPWIDTRRRSRAAPLAHPVDPQPSDVALLQYTSGSTSRPKGVPLTFGNLAHQFTVHAERCLMGPGIRAAVWLPHFHDYFLISSLLATLHHGGRLWFCSPLAFLKRPALWFDLIHRVRATHTAAPNFAYGMAVAKTTPEQRSRWDLSCLRQHLCGAEPIQAATIDRFHEAFAVTGIDPGTFAPGYGLAEHTVAVTTAGEKRVRVDSTVLATEGRLVPSDDPGSSQVLIGNGPVVGDIDLRIVDPDTGVERARGHVGEIWVDSPSKGPGYHRHPTATAERYHARMQPDRGRDYLRTGDLGALHDGELYVTGRLKEMIIVRGRNLYPHDLEATVADLEGVRKGGVLAFAVAHDGAEGYGILVEPRTPGALDGKTEAIQGALVRDHQVAPQVILVAPRGSVPKTTSGKLRRRNVADRFAARDPELLRWSVAAPVAKRADAADPQVRRILDALAAEGVDARPDQHLRDLGLDSLRLVAVGAALDRAGVPDAFERLLGDGTVRDLADVPATPRATAPARGGSGLSAFQRALLDDLDALPNAHVMSLPFRFTPPPDPDVLIDSLHALVERYPLLGSAWTIDGPQPGAPLQVGRHSRGADAVDDTLLTLAAQPLPIATGPAMAADLIETSAHTTVLLRLHHLAYDAQHALRVASDWLDRVRAHRTGAAAPRHQIGSTDAFLQHERAAIEDPVLKAFWRQELHGVRPLPLRAGRLSHGRLDVRTVHQAPDLLETVGGTAFTTLLTTYQLALARVFGRDDVVVASTVSQRHRAALVDHDGPAVQYAAFRLRVAGTLQQVFADAPDRVLAVIRHSALPLPAQLAAADAELPLHGPALAASLNLYDFATHPDGDRITTLRRGEPVPVGDGHVTCPRLPADYPADRPYPLMLSGFVGPKGVACQLRSHPERVDSARADAVAAAMADVVRMIRDAPGTDARSWISGGR
jgi:acyl-CoA synthetase (AMP-forming)/AMP-acid ligase II/aryl carrier-like protein